MKKNTKVTGCLLGIALGLGAVNAVAAPAKTSEPLGEILFKVHDIVPEIDESGKVLYCNIGATFFNRTQVEVNNAVISLKWADDVISDIIDQEERAEKELQRSNPKANKSRYPTASTTEKVITLGLKLPSLKIGQQVSLKTKVDTDRCFLLLNDMDVVVENCGTASMSDKASRQSCANLFRYIGPKNAEYYTEFKEISPEEQLAIADAEFASVQAEVKQSYNDAIATIDEITKDSAEDKNN